MWTLQITLSFPTFGPQKQDGNRRLTQTSNFLRSRLLWIADLRAALIAAIRSDRWCARVAHVTSFKTYVLGCTVEVTTQSEQRYAMSSRSYRKNKTAVATLSSVQLLAATGLQIVQSLASRRLTVRTRYLHNPVKFSTLVTPDS